MNLRTLTHQEMWGIDIVAASAPADLAGLLDNAESTDTTNLIAPTSCCFWADPFAIDDSTVLAEQLDFERGAGTIVEIGLEDPSRRRTLLADDIHSSYPFVLRDNDQTFVVPERVAAGRLEYYRYHADQALELVHTTLPGRRIVDPTIVEHDGHWYLFAVDGAVDNSSTLELFISDDPLGPWEVHPASPIVVDSRRARPAGALHTIEHTLWRPAQDCGEVYGGAVRLQQVDQLDPEHYRETDGPIIHSPVPHRGLGCHTLNRFPDGRWLLDTKTERVAVTNRHIIASKARMVMRIFRQ